MTKTTDVTAKNVILKNEAGEYLIPYTGENGGSGGSLPIGTVIPLVCSSGYVPEGCLPCDGSEYSQTQFTDLWSNYLTAETPLLSTCTYEEYASDITTYGQCAKFAVDTTNKKFKVPTIKDGAVIQQASGDAELGKSYNAGLPNITGKLFANTQWANGSSSGAFTTSNYRGYVTSGGETNYGCTTYTLDASLSSSIYGNSDTVQMNAVAIRYFVVVANGTINDSQMDWSSWASGLTSKIGIDGSGLVTSSANSTGGVRAVVDTYVNGTSWYRLWSDGWIEQGGVISASTTTLLKEYSDTNYSIFLGYTAGTDGCWFTGDKTTTTFTQYIKYYGISQKAHEQANYWYACGY